MGSSRGHADFITALRHLANARDAFEALAHDGLILGNDNHIGDIGEYWVRRYYELKGRFESYGTGKNCLFDIKLKGGDCVSVKTLTAWSHTGYGTPVRTDGGHWEILAAVYLDKILFPSRIAIVPLQELISKDVFVKNATSRSLPERPTTAHPRFQWWPWLDDYLVRFKIKDDDMELVS